MKSAIYYGIKDVRVEDVEVPAVRPGEVKVAIKYCGICGSDLHEYLHGPFAKRSWGHEACGRIVEVGSQIDDCQIGDRVAVFGRGSYAEYTVVPRQRVLLLPDAISDERAAVLEPLAGAAYAIEKGGVKAEDTVFIAGAGPVGLMVLLAVKSVGVKSIFISDISPGRRQMALEMGATQVLDPHQVKIPQIVRELTQGQGADVSVEAAGVADTLKDSLASTRFQGTVIVQGIFTEKVAVHMLAFVTKEMRMIGTNSVDPARALLWQLGGDIEPEAMITDIIPLSDIVKSGFDVLNREKDRSIKVLVAPELG